MWPGKAPGPDTDLIRALAEGKENLAFHCRYLYMEVSVQLESLRPPYLGQIHPIIFLPMYKNDRRHFLPGNTAAIIKKTKRQQYYNENDCEVLWADNFSILTHILFSQVSIFISFPRTAPSL